MKATVCIISAIFFTSVVFSQAPFSAAYNEVLKQRSMNNYPTSKWDSLRCARFGECAPQQIQQPVSVNYCPLAKRFFGWHAIGTSSSSYQWALMTDRKSVV